MTIRKVTRGSWAVENGGPTYATVKQMADYDNNGKWSYGWHVTIRGSTLGVVYRKGSSHLSRPAAIAEAIKLLG